MVDDSRKEAVTVTEMVLDDSGADACTFDDVAGACCGESFFADAADRLVNDEFPGTVCAFLSTVPRPP
ncbi:hypothetical protein MNVM_18750 [Mycobacterium novum]|uniref:Uncharacterized protein n=2 Tax=Mycobacteriaceae TaxID=1762 RepID=A0A7I9XN87_9MYCO|nr:hypothetical protein MNVM_18750 [Mycobacterium novum]GFG71441.1 hypothetical protein MSEN_31610 [Mycolicibacter senuensis]